MISPKGFVRQVAAAMTIVAITTLLLTYVSFYLFYLLAMRYLPSILPPEGTLLPSLVDVLVLGSVALFVLSFSMVIAMRLANRIVAPLHAVGQAARRIAEGDLTARAQPTKELPGEAALLVADFNIMAARLEEIAEDIVTWNAQIAHELRTPLTVLQGRIQGLIDGVFVPDEALFRKLLRQVEGLSRLVEDLRVVSLVDSGRLSLELTEIDVSEEIADFGALVEPGLQQAGFTLALGAEPGKARLDATRIRQALLALADNAQRHANPCELRIEAAVRPREVEFRVVDQGPGLPGNFIDDAFKQFSSYSQREEAAHAGAGLGLSVVQAIATAHGGVASYCHDERGSAFIITVPRAL